MKYVLVIDVPEPLESEDVKVDYLCYYHCGNIIENKIDVFPKPLPNRWIPQLNGLSTEQQIRNIDFAGGWNACLEKIVGETE